MKLQKLYIEGFRNFDSEEISFQQKTLIIGANDVGKTNLIYALRLLFDKTISEHDLELTDSDYNAYSKTDTIRITASLSEVTEECLLSVFAGAIKDGNVVIRYTNSKNDTYKIFIGYDENTLTEIPTRQYIKRLNMQYVDTNRDLMKFLSRERVKMLQISKENLNDVDNKLDADKILEIQDGLNLINEQISSLKYVSSSLEEVNCELGKLSIHNEDQTVRFIAGESNAEKLLDNLVLSYSTGDTPLSIGGDGRKNQIFLATWIAKQHLQENIDHVTFYAIEEPEAHLHPHQQRKLSEYIQNSFDAQILVTSHSPHIASKFDPSSVVRLFVKNKSSYAACGGCSDVLKRTIENFGYRLNALSAETFFSDGVFLVEGTSEVLLYTAVAKEIGIDLDYLNISVLSVEGVGFRPYVAVCNALNIPWVLKTDNDIFSKPANSPKYKYFAGISRIVKIIEEVGDDGQGILDYWNAHEKENEWLVNDSIPNAAKALNTYIRGKAVKLGMYVSDEDLENDLVNSELQEILLKHYQKRSLNTLVKAMQKKKATNMLEFTNKNQTHLNLLKESDILKPLNMLVKIVTERTKPHGEETDN